MSTEAYALWAQAAILLLSAIVILWQLFTIKDQVVQTKNQVLEARIYSQSAAYQALIAQVMEIDRMVARFPHIEPILYDDMPQRQPAYIRAEYVGTMLLDLFDNILTQHAIGLISEARMGPWKKFIMDELKYSRLLHQLLTESLEGTYSQTLLELAREPEAKPEADPDFYEKKNRS